MQSKGTTIKQEGKLDYNYVQRQGLLSYFTGNCFKFWVLNKLQMACVFFNEGGRTLLTHCSQNN